MSEINLPIDANFSGITLNGAKETKFECSYCEGYTLKNPETPTTWYPEVSTLMDIHFPNQELQDINRKICPRCYVKVFDSVLGAPKNGQT